MTEQDEIRQMEAKELLMTDIAGLNMMETFTLRMLGQNVTLRRYAWVELLDDLRPESELAGRIRKLIV